jgi:hypothetical protein
LQIDQRILFVRDGVVHGWALDRSAPDRALTVEAVADGQVFVQALADRSLDLPARMRGPGADAHGFALQVFSKWLPKVIQRGSRSIDLRIKDGGYLARGLEVFAPGASIDSSPFQGYCDSTDNGAIVGWVWRPADPDQHVDVAVFVDGKFHTRLRAENHRDDLVAHGIGHGDHGFRAPLNYSDLGVGEHTVEVFVAEHGLELKRSSLVLRVQQRVEPSQRRARARAGARP